MNYKIRLENGFLPEDIINSKTLEDFNNLISKKYIGCPGPILEELRALYSKVSSIKHQGVKDSLRLIKEWSEDNDSHSLITDLGICGNFDIVLIKFFETEINKSLFPILGELTLLYLEEFIHHLTNIIFGTVIIPLFEKWPKFSGNINYPVPHPNKQAAPSIIYCNEAQYSTLWIGEYGNLRKELLDFLIKETENKFLGE